MPFETPFPPALFAGTITAVEHEHGGVTPPSIIRTTGHQGRLKVSFGSCRVAAPHEPPWTLELASDPRGRGVDALVPGVVRGEDRAAGEVGGSGRRREHQR